jgi:hypothetical protein
MSSPSWISDLQDPALKANFIAFADRRAPITEADLANAFTALADEVSNNASNPTLTQSQLSDLESIAANIGSMGASSYLQFITNAFVNGDAANATWTGGQNASTQIGNLTAGASATDLTDLVDKWFLGTDLPSDVFTYSSSDGPPQTYAIEYSSDDASLYGPGKQPQMSDVNQGQFGDCYLLSSLAEIAHQDPSVIKSMITSHKNGTYGVRFYENGEPVYVTVNKELPNIGNSGSNIWASVVEVAYVELQQQGLTTDNSINDGNSFTTTGNGGWPASALEAITGATQINEFGAKSGQTGWSDVTLSHALAPAGASSSQTTSIVLSTLAADLLVGDDAVLASYANATDPSGMTTLVDDHAMSIYGYDASTGMLEIRNPWGSEPGQNWDTTFEESLTTLQSDGDYIDVDNVGAATSVSNASVVAAAGLQNMAQIKSFSVSDSVPNIDGALPALVADNKLTSVTAAGTSGADTLNLSGLGKAATIDMGGDTDTASLRSGSLNLGSGYDSVTLGSGPSTIAYSFSGGGVESIANFHSAFDLLSISLAGGSLEQTLVNGGDWISSSIHSGEGVFLANVATTQHVTQSRGIATLV